MPKNTLRSQDLKSIIALTPSGTGKRADKGGVVQILLVTSDLRMTHCRLAVEGDANAIMLSYGSAELNRCEILTQSWAGIRWNFDGAAKLVVNESVIASPEMLSLHAFAVREKFHDLEVRIHRSTVVGGESFIGWLVDQVQPAHKDKRKPMRVHAAESIFCLQGPAQSMMAVNCNVEGEYQEAAKAKALLDQAVSWSEERNLYPGQSLIALREWKKSKLLPNGHLCANLHEWCKFWGIAPTKSTQGTAQFQGGDILAKLKTNIHAVTPGDFNLVKGSPGQTEGKDLGADTKVVGPGEAYETFKKMPAYQEWRKQSDALINAASRTP